MRLIIGLIGDKLAGKDSAAGYLVERYGAQHLRYSEILDEILELLDEPVGREGETALARALREGFNENVLGQGIIKKIRASSNPLLVLNGIRYPGEVSPLEALGAHIVYITAPVELRYMRYLARQEKVDDGKLDFEEFRSRDSVGSNEAHIAELGARAEVIIENLGTVEEFRAKLDAMLAGWHV